MANISKNSKIEVAVYQGEEMIASGNINDVAKQLNVRADTIYFYTMPTHRRRIERRGGDMSKNRIAVRLEDDKWGEE